MAVLNFKPNRLRYKIDVVQGYTDDNGDYHQGKSEWSEYINCDSVPSSGEANALIDTNGNKVNYSYVVYMSTNVKDFKFGEIVRLERYGIEYEYSVKGFQRYQTQVKLWV